MKRKTKQLIAIICFVSILISFTGESIAFERADHDKYMLEVLFKNFKEVNNDSSVQDEIEALECASYLTIDQFNSNGQNDLNTLIAYGVKNIPSSISKISFSASGTTHRSSTHRGWDYSYSGIMKDLWPTRQDILRNTIGEIFDFKDEPEQQEAFCELIYYIHILGDHLDDDSWKISNGLKMEIGGRVDQEDIIHKLLDCIKILFKDQSHTHKYNSLTGALNRANTKFSKIVRSEGGINTDEKFSLHQEYAKDLMDLLTYYLPEMLKDESFFSAVFYK